MLIEISKEEYITHVINDVKENEKEVRQSAKSPYFLLWLMYGGTHRGLHKQCGFSIKKSKGIEKAYHNMYKQHGNYVVTQLDKASKCGFVTLAFGLKLKTPLVSKSKEDVGDLYEVEQEKRSAGNALFQSYGLLTLRAFTTFMYRVWKHELYDYEIRPIVTIYDSIYLDIPDDIDCLKWVNDNLIECMEDTSGCPELYHEVVKLSANLEVYYPSWKYPTELPNGSSKKELDILIKKIKSKGH